MVRNYPAIVSLFCIVFWARSSYGASLDPLRNMRPVPSDILPVIDIEEGPPTEFDPKEGDIDNNRLQEKLGSNYNPSFMSPTKPDQLIVPLSTTKPKHLKSKMTDEFKSLRINRRQRRKFLNWIWEITQCPVHYRWDDMGIRYWPRWIKKGGCDSTQSCSIPKGMGCAPVGSTKITILRWHCQGILPNKKYCTWLPVQYPIVSECKCSC